MHSISKFSIKSPIKVQMCFFTVVSRYVVVRVEMGVVVLETNQNPRIFK